MPKVKPVPDGVHSVTPHLICAGASTSRSTIEDALAFYPTRSTRSSPPGG